MEVRVHADKAEVAAAAGDELLTALADAQAERGHAAAVLTGGGLGIALLAHLRDHPERDRVDWRRVDLWWGDERFLPSGHPDRNETQARDALLDGLPLDPARVHAMPATDGPDGDDPDAAAARYAAELGRGGGLPTLDVCLLGVGDDGHVASLFPGHPQVASSDPVVAVRDSPKPPPTRISLTFGVLNSARQVWLVVAGAEKSLAVGRAVAGAEPAEIPAAAARGRERTVLFVDEAAGASVIDRR